MLAGEEQAELRVLCSILLVIFSFCVESVAGWFNFDFPDNGQKGGHVELLPK